MDEILHRLRNPRMIVSRVNTNQQWFPMVEKWCEMDFIHSQYVSLPASNQRQAALPLRLAIVLATDGFVFRGASCMDSSSSFILQKAVAFWSPAKSLTFSGLMENPLVVGKKLGPNIQAKCPKEINSKSLSSNSEQKEGPNPPNFPTHRGDPATRQLRSISKNAPYMLPKKNTGKNLSAIKTAGWLSHESNFLFGGSPGKSRAWQGSNTLHLQA